MGTPRRLRSYLGRPSRLRRGGGTSSTTATSSVELSGTAAKGILRGAEVKAYEIIDGKQSTIVLATAKTDNNGKYTLKVKSTTNPVLVEVKVVAGTKMLDETQITAAGEFTEVVAPEGLTMRSFTTDVNEAPEVHINPYTEAAVKIAEQTTVSSLTGRLSPDVLLSSQDFVLRITPMGVNPFRMAGISKPPTNDEADKKAWVEDMKSLMKDKAKIKEAIEAKTNNIKPIRNAVGKFTATIKGETIEIDPEAVKAKQGFWGFVNAVRTALRATLSASESAEKDLQQQYAGAATNAVEYLSDALTAAISECTKNRIELAGTTCVKDINTEVLPTFKRWGYGDYDYPSYFACLKSAEGVCGTPKFVYNRRGTIKIVFTSQTDWTITASSSKIVNEKEIPEEIPDGTMNLSAFVPTLTENETKAVLNGVITVSNFVPNKPKITGELNVSNLAFTLSTPASSSDSETTSVEGGIALVLWDNDKPRGDGLSGSLKVAAGQMQLNLSATNKNSPLASLNLSYQRDALPDPKKLISQNNFKPGTASVTLGLPAGTTIVNTYKHDTFKNLNAYLTVKTPNQAVTLEGVYKFQELKSGLDCLNVDSRPEPTYSEAIPSRVLFNPLWCANQWTLKSNSNIYTATISKAQSNGHYSGNIKRGDTVVGKIVNGVLQVDGKEVSIY